jgi:hypothetical protein
MAHARRRLVPPPIGSPFLPVWVFATSRNVAVALLICATRFGLVYLTAGLSSLLCAALA